MQDGLDILGQLCIQVLVLKEKSCNFVHAVHKINSSKLTLRLAETWFDNDGRQVTDLRLTLTFKSEC